MSKSFQYELSIVTGASSGLGKAFADALAERGSDLVIIARDLIALEALAEFLQGKYNVNVYSLAIDLCAANAIERVFEFVDEIGCTPNLLINNAGSG